MVKKGKFMRIMEYVREHYADNPSGRQIKEDLRLSPFLVQRFRETYGNTPKRLVDRLRMQDAVRLLQETNFPVSEIAKMLSYSSEAEFCRQFYGRFSLMPAVFRQEMRKE